VQTIVELAQDDNFAWSPDQAAVQVLAALGGAVANGDSSVIQITMPPGTAGELAPPALAAAQEPDAS
jgi:hypothetical protein